MTPEYYANLDHNGVRRDIADRPELTYGTVEFLASAEYCLREPMPGAYLFVIDVSHTSVQSGVLSSVLGTVKLLLDRILTEGQ